MKTISDYLDAYARARGISSDYAIARELNLTRQAVSRYRRNVGTPDLDVLWKIADTTGADLSELIATAEMERANRAHDDARARLWSQRLRDLSAALCVVSIGVFGVVAALPANAATALQCILCQIAKADPRRQWWHSATIANRSIFQRSKIFCLQ